MSTLLLCLYVGGDRFRRVHQHHVASNYEPTIDKTESDVIHDDYPSDFRWPDSYFDVEASSDVAVVVGQTAFLVCRVAVAGNWTVSPQLLILFLFVYRLCNTIDRLFSRKTITALLNVLSFQSRD